MGSSLPILQSLFSLLLLPLLPITTFRVVTSTTFPADTAALRAVKEAVESSSIPPASCLSSWDFAVDPCDAAFGVRFTCGIRCDTHVDDLRRVTELALDPAGYAGTLSPAVWSLPYLQSLDLADNRLAGTIPPPPPGSLPPSLLRITLSRNSFSGAIPALAPAPALEELYLDGNLLTGGIPASLADLRRLRRVELQGNNLTGGIPDLRSLTSLYFLDASDNALSGGFPGAAALPATVVEVSLRGNQLDGELTGVAGLAALQVLDLSKNWVSGAVPAAVFEHPSLEQLTLAHNRLESVEAPGDSGAGSGLVAVDLGHNLLSGLLPGFLASMPRLSAVDLQDNRFTGMIPAEYAIRAAGGGAVVPFGRLLLSGNYLFGPIPSPLGGLKEGTARVSLADNCLFRCPPAFFFCEGGQQKPPATCRDFNPVIP